MNIENIHIGFTAKNYKHMCEVLGEEIKTAGGAKKSQLKKWASYFEFKKDGNKIIVTDIFHEQRELSRGGNFKHGLSGHRLYSIWKGMKDRCCNTKSPNYQYYGERGILICDEWLNEDCGFINFYNWSLENGYDDNLTIDRKNNDGNYEPSNCRWTTMLVQIHNRRIPKKKLKNIKENLDQSKYIKYLETEIINLNRNDIIENYRGEK